MLNIFFSTIQRLPAQKRRRRQERERVCVCKTDKWKKSYGRGKIFLCVSLILSLNQQTWLLKQFVVFRWQGFGIAKDHRPSERTEQNLRQNSMQRKLKITFRSRCQSPCFSLFLSLFSAAPPLRLSAANAIDFRVYIKYGRKHTMWFRLTNPLVTPTNEQKNRNRTEHNVT